MSSCVACSGIPPGTTPPLVEGLQQCSAAAGMLAGDQFSTCPLTEMLQLLLIGGGWPHLREGEREVRTIGRGDSLKRPMWSGQGAPRAARRAPRSASAPRSGKLPCVGQGSAAIAKAAVCLAASCCFCGRHAGRAKGGDAGGARRRAWGGGGRCRARALPQHEAESSAAHTDRPQLLLAAVARLHRAGSICLGGLAPHAHAIRSGGAGASAERTRRQAARKAGRTPLTCCLAGGAQRVLLPLPRLAQGSSRLVGYSRFTPAREPRDPLASHLFPPWAATREIA